MFRSGCRARWRSIFVGAICLVCGACGSSEPGQIPVFPAVGKVTWNGEPLPGAILVFHPKKPLVGPDKKPAPVPGANSREDGTFLVSTYTAGDGLPEGEYDVTVSCENRSAKKVKDEYPELLPAVYQNPATSGFTVTIASGKNELKPFELKR